MEKQIKEILQTLTAMQGVMATKADLTPFATKADLKPFATKADLEAIESRMATRSDRLEQKFEDRMLETKSHLLSHIDGFIGLHSKLDIEFTALRDKYNRLEGQVSSLAKHVKFQLS